jgi:hypothetical protein
MNTQQAIDAATSACRRNIHPMVVFMSLTAAGFKQQRAATIVLWAMKTISANKCEWKSIG